MKIYVSRGSLGLAIAALAVMFTGCDEKSAPVAAGPVTVLVANVQQRDVPVYREWLGTLDGSANADIRSRVSGYLLSQEYKEGKYVKTGDVLFTIDSKPYEAALDQAKADFAKAQAQQVKTQADSERALKLSQQKVISDVDRDAAVQGNLASVAQVEAAKAAVRQAELNLGYTKITAPIDGLTGISPVGTGDLIQAGAGDPLTVVSTVDPIKATFLISEQQYLEFATNVNAAVNRPVADRQHFLELTLADGTVHPEKGVFDSADRNVDVRTGSVKLTALFPNPTRVLRPGQYARIRGAVRLRTGALLVPQRAVNELQGTYSVIIVGADNKAEVRPVKVAERIGPDWVIESGLNPGERVVVEGGLKVRPGAVVNPQPYVAAGAAQVPAAK